MHCFFTPLSWITRLTRGNGFVVALGLLVSAMPFLAAQPVIDSNGVLGIWEFDDPANPGRSADLMQETPMVFRGAAAFSVDGGGRSGLAGDRALNLGTAGGNYATIDDAGFIGLVNAYNQQHDRITIVFWQKWSTSIASSASVYCVSAGATGGNRGLQTHMPWTDNTIFYDHSGCCATPAQRLSGASPAGHSWQQWHHVAIVKNGGTKQVWINGQLHLSQSSGASALLADWTRIQVGAMPDGTSSVRGLIDDFAMFSIALGQAEIAALAGGARPSAIVTPIGERPPRIGGLTPADGTRFCPAGGAVGFTVTTAEPNTLPASKIRFFINGQDHSGALAIGGTALERSVTFTGSLPAGGIFHFRAEAEDDASRQSTAHWTIDTLDAAIHPDHGPLALAAMSTATLSTTKPTHPANLAIDGNPASVAETLDQPGSFLEIELDRAVTASRFYLTAPEGGDYAGVLDGAVVRFYDLRDQLVHETTIVGLAPGGIWGVVLPPGTVLRIIRVELPAGQSNGAGDHRIAVADIKLAGDPSPAYGPLNLAAIGKVSQSSTFAAGSEAGKAIDGNPNSYSQTGAGLDEWWLLTLDRTRRVDRIEIVNRLDANAARLQGLTLRLLDEGANTLAVTTVANPGLGATWGFDVPAGTAPVRYVRIGLENGATNGQGDRNVQLGDVSVLTGTNFALNTTAYMVRLQDSLPSPALANDGNYATHTQTTDKTVDGWWETDLGSVQTLYAVRAMGFGGATDQYRLSRAVVRLFDADHESVFSAPLSAYQLEGSSVFDAVLPGPVQARYVRVGFEDKTRSSPTGAIEWYLRLKEVQAFGRPAGEVGLFDFTATPENISGGASAMLGWRQNDLNELVVYPGIGSVGAFTDPVTGLGEIEVSPVAGTEYTLVGRDRFGATARHVTVTVDGQPLQPRISEFCASNAASLSDGYGDAPDWIELRNPNGDPLDLGGYGLSDNPAQPMKWSFPAGTVMPAHGALLVMASGRNEGPDAKGYLHTNFSLAAAGESVVLTMPDGTTTADAMLNYPPQREDLAYGRNAEGGLTFLEATPGAFNLATSFGGWLEAPVFSRERGFHESPFSLVLADPNPESALFYSLDGSEPSVPYSGPITIAGSTAVRAVARHPGFHSPAVVTHTYLFKDSVMSSPLMNATYTQGALASRLRDSLTQLPTLCISVPAIPDDRVEREASVEILMPDGSPHFQVNGGMVRYGGAWTEFAKKSYRLRFRDRYGDNRLRHPIFRGFDRGVPVREDIRTINLNAGNHDMSQRGFYMSQRFLEDSMLEMGSLNPHGRFVHLYLNGVYWGQYHAQERLEDAMLAAYLGGRRSDYVNVLGNDNVGDDFVPGTPEPPNREAWETTRANRSNYEFVKDYVDLPHLTDTMLLWTYGNCESEFRCAGPVSAPGSGFKFWLGDGDGFLRTSADRTDRLGPGGIFGALRTAGHPDFKMLVADRIYKHFFNNGALTPARNLARLNARMAEINDSMIAECARWGYRTPDNWLSAANDVRNNLFPTRTATLFGYWKSRGLYPNIDAPLFSQHGGSVPRDYPLVMSAAAGTIYYRTDGGDPRLPGGGIAPEALVAGTTTTALVTAGAVWKYWDGASYPAANWHTPAYSDAGWASGAAPLGYGGGQTTTIGFGPNSSSKYMTACFRRTFTVSNPAEITGLTLGIARDDGAVVYLNGVEIARSNMPAGTISFNTAASSVVAGDAKFNFNTLQLTPPPGLLLAAPAQNLIAVEIHQQSGSSGDLYLNLSLTASATTVVTLSDNTTVQARALQGGTWSALADVSFQIAHPLVAAGPYQLGEWAAASPAGTWPNAMRFHQTDLPDPSLATAMETPWTLPYNLTSRSRINGLGENGIGFVNTGNAQDLPGAGFVGAAVLNLDTTAAQGVRVLWTGGTVVANDRDYGIRLQYRVGESGLFTDVIHQDQPVEYLRNPVAGHSAVIGPVTLPADADNRPLVQLRWKYYYRSGTSGARAQLRLDDILVTAGTLPPAQITFESSPAAAQSGAPLGPVVVRLFDANGWPALGYDGPVTLTPGGAGSLSGTLTVNAADGTALFGDLVLTGTGEHQLTATAGELTTVSPAFRSLALSSLLVPQFIQGGMDEAGENNNRVPFAWRARIDGLVPHASYRVANRMVTTADGPASDGAGNMVFVTGHDTDWIRSTAGPRFLASDLGTRHSGFTAGADGSFSAWFVTEPTGNTRFTPGNLLYPRLILNDGADGETAVHHLTCSDHAMVLEFGSAADQGSAISGSSFAPGRRFAALFATAGERPLAVTPVEATGALLDDRYAGFYLTGVAAATGRWGSLIPNTLPTGVRRIEFLDTSHGGPLYQIAAQAALTGTVDGLAASTINPANGLVPLILDHPEQPTAYDQWRMVHFPEPADFADAAISGPAAVPPGDAISNLLRYALGVGPHDPVAGRLPAITNTPGGGFAFRFPYDPNKSDLILRVLASPDLGEWSQVVLDSEQDPLPPGADGWVDVPLDDEGGLRTFWRLMIELR
jgi:hypothetical protein